MPFRPFDTTAAASSGSGYACNNRPRFSRGPLPVPLPLASWQDAHRSINTARPATSTGSGVPAGPASTSGEMPDPQPAAATKHRARATDRRAITASLTAIFGNILGYGLRSHTEAAAHSIRLLVCGSGPAGVRRTDSVGSAGLKQPKCPRTPTRLPGSLGLPPRPHRTEAE